MPARLFHTDCIPPMFVSSSARQCQQKLCKVIKVECDMFLQVYSAEPILGVQFTVEDVAKPLKDMTIHRKYVCWRNYDASVLVTDASIVMDAACISDLSPSVLHSWYLRMRLRLLNGADDQCHVHRAVAR